MGSLNQLCYVLSLTLYKYRPTLTTFNILRSMFFNDANVLPILVKCLNRKRCLLILTNHKAYLDFITIIPRCHVWLVSLSDRPPF